MNFTYFTFLLEYFYLSKIDFFLLKTIKCEYFLTFHVRMYHTIINIYKTILEWQAFEYLGKYY